MSTRSWPRLFSVLASALAAACVPQVAPEPTPAPPPVAARPTPRPVVQPLADDWRDWPPTPGTWTYRQDGRGSLALFGPAGGDALLTLRCDRAARRMYVSRSGSAAAPLVIRTTSTTRQLAVQPTGGTPPYVAAALAADDRLLDAMAFSRGHIAVEQQGTATLVVPAWAEIGRVTEDCRG
ncbi:hypothetical protein ACU5AX_12210 [Sphingomonas sp. XXL09]|uniref:hypothetical protein n=1 Tax=Sphingomonas sp. XXL09 TaxID=3457787 RepID=UPI00406BB145